MRIRLLIGIVVCIAIIACVGNAPNAAQSLSQPTCGHGPYENGNIFIQDFGHNGPPTNWYVDFSADCGGQQTINWFIQQTTDGFVSWQTVASHQIGNTTSIEDFYTGHDRTLVQDCSPARTYRVKINTESDSKTLNWNPCNLPGG